MAHLVTAWRHSYPVGGFSGSLAGAELVALQADQAFEASRGQIERRLTRIQFVEFRSQKPIDFTFDGFQFIFGVRGPDAAGDFTNAVDKPSARRPTSPKKSPNSG